jgi:hypothetical protein
MGIVISTTITSPFSLVCGIIGLIGFAFTLGTFFSVVWTNLATLAEAQHEVHSYLTNLRQELLEERTSLKFLKKACNKRTKTRDSRYGRDVQDYLDLQLDAATIKTMADSVRHMIKQFQALERPFLEPGEEGIQRAMNNGSSSGNNRRSSRRRGDSGSPYYTQEAYRSASREKRARGPNNEDHGDDDGEVFWPQRVRYCDFTLHRRFQWLRRKSKVQQLFDDLSRMHTRRAAVQVEWIALMMNDFAGARGRD